MTTPEVQPRVNLNTWIAVLGFAVTITGGFLAIGRFQAETEASQLQTTEQINALKQQQATDTARIDARAQSLEAAINTLNIRDARNDERMNSILETLRRIDAKISAQDERQNGARP